MLLVFSKAFSRMKKYEVVTVLIKVFSKKYDYFGLIRPNFKKVQNGLISKNSNGCFEETTVDES